MKNNAPDQPATSVGVRVQRLVRRHAASSFMDFPAPIACKCGGRLVVKDHCFHPAMPTASREMRYEVRCDKCFYTDPNGYASHAEVMDAYVPNVPVSNPDEPNQIK